jgi:hypothetical protein
MGIMSQPGGYGSDTYNALVGGMNRSQQDRGFDRGKWSSALGRPELAAVDPSDWRTWEKIILSGGNPDDYEVTGIMGAMPEERQMAELTEDQMNMMGNPLNTPDFGVSKEDLWNRVKDMEDKGFFGWGAQEPTTQEEYDDYYRQLQEGSVGNWVT